MKEFRELNNNDYFFWNNRLFQKIKNVYIDDRLVDGIAKELGVIDENNTYGKEGGLFFNPQGESNFNPFCLVNKVQIYFEDLYLLIRTSILGPELFIDKVSGSYDSIINLIKENPNWIKEEENIWVNSQTQEQYTLIKLEL